MGYPLHLNALRVSSDYGFRTVVFFYSGLKGRGIDTAPVEPVWNGISDARLQDYRNSVPQAWSADAAVDDAIHLIRGVRDNIAAAMAEVRRVLT